jgi:hypothetical protein
MYLSLSLSLSHPLSLTVFLSRARSLSLSIRVAILTGSLVPAVVSGRALRRARPLSLKRGWMWSSGLARWSLWQGYSCRYMQGVVGSSPGSAGKKFPH